MPRVSTVLLSLLVLFQVLVSCQQPATPQKGSIPPSPTDVVAESGDGTVTITWQPSAGATEYRLYYATSAGVTSSSDSLTKTNQTSFTHTGLSNGTNYYYRVSSVNSSGKSTLSAEVMATPHSSSFGVTSAIQGTWNKVTEEITNHEVGEVTYTYTDSWSFSDSSVCRTQSRTEYADSTEDEVDYSRGSVEYRSSDGMLLVVLDEESDDGETWTDVTEDRYYFRNLVIDGAWHPGAYVRKAAGTGINGTWESPVLENEAMPKKFRLAFDTSTMVVTSQAYELDEEGNLSTPSGDENSADFTWDAPTLTISGTAMTSPLLTKDYLDYPSGSGGLPRVFLKQ